MIKSNLESDLESELESDIESDFLGDVLVRIGFVADTFGREPLAVLAFSLRWRHFRGGPIAESLVTGLPSGLVTVLGVLTSLLPSFVTSPTAATSLLCLFLLLLMLFGVDAGELEREVEAVHLHRQLFQIFLLFAFDDAERAVRHFLDENHGGEVLRSGEKW